MTTGQDKWCIRNTFKFKSSFSSSLFFSAFLSFLTILLLNDPPCSALPTQPDHPLLVRLLKDHRRRHRVDCRKPQKAGQSQKTIAINIKHLPSQDFAFNLAELNPNFGLPPTISKKNCSETWIQMDLPQSMQNWQSKCSLNKNAPLHWAINQINQAVIIVDM